jgi:outer membrane protein TolC
MRLSAGLALGLLAGTPVLAGAEALSRADVVARALDVNPAVQKSLQELIALNGQRDEALADALPELKLLSSFSRYRDPSLLNSSSFDAFPPDLRDSLAPVPANVYESTVTLKQTLFSFKLGAAIRAARMARTAGDEEVRRARQDVALEAVRTYNDYLLSLERLRVGEKVVVYKERQLEMAKNRRAAGVATDLDVLRSEVDLENQRASLLALKGAADLAGATLNAVMVRPIDTPIEPTDSLVYQPLDMSLEEVTRAAWQNRPEARTIELSEKIYGELVGVAKAEGRPSLDFFGYWGYSVRQPENFFDSTYTKWSASVALTVPLFDGFRTRGKVAQARAKQDQVGQDRVELENRIRLAARDALDRLHVAQSVLAAAELNVSQAQKALDMTQANYSLGAATFLDVLDAQAALTVAESNRILALHTHANGRAMLRYVMAESPLDPPAAPVPPSAGIQP